MIQKIIHRLIYRRHFWREVGLNELSEIYASQFLRSLALNIIGIFVPIYLYKTGYSLQSLFFMYFIWFAVKPIFCFIAAKLVANIGPKHTMAFSNAIYIVYLSLVITITDLHWPLALIAIIGSFATTTFYLAFEVDFSKIKHSEHGGKEISYEQIFERVGAVIGPLIGGIVASFIDPRYTIAMAIMVLCGSLVPIFMSAEPTHLHQRISFRGFPWRRHKHDFISGVAYNVENLISVFIWPLFIAVTVLTINTYATLGIIMAVSTGVALIVIYMIGKLIDDRRGGMLLKAGVFANAVLHLFRPFAKSVGFVFGINLANEPITAAYRLPYMKGRFDAADNLTGYRIVYFTINTIVASIGNAILLLIIWLLSMLIDPVSVMRGCFVIGSIASLIILSQRFLALRDR